MWGVYAFWNGRSQTIIPTALLLVLALAALVGLRGCLRPMAILWTLPVFVSVVAVISRGSWRFRQPGDTGWILPAAALPFAAHVRATIAGREQGIRE
jgi:hypothetical protein